MTEKELQDRIAKAVDKAAEKIKARAMAKVWEKDTTKKIVEAGYSLRYYDRVSFAYKDDIAFFTVRSTKDSFSRPAARKALLHHIEEGTHRFNIAVPNAEGKNFPLEEDLTMALSIGLAKRAKTAPHEVPSKYRKELRKKLDGVLR